MPVCVRVRVCDRVMQARHMQYALYWNNLGNLQHVKNVCSSMIEFCCWFFVNWWEFTLSCQYWLWWSVLLWHDSILALCVFCVKLQRHSLTYVKRQDFWATVCKTVRPMLSVRCLSVLSVRPVCLSVHCGQTVGWIRMKLGTQVLGRPQPRTHCVRFGPSSSPANGHSPPIFGTSVVAKGLLVHESRCHLVWR